MKTQSLVVVPMAGLQHQTPQRIAAVLRLNMVAASMAKQKHREKILKGAKQNLFIEENTVPFPKNWVLVEI